MALVVMQMPNLTFLMMWVYLHRASINTQNILSWNKIVQKEIKLGTQCACWFIQIKKTKDLKTLSHYVLIYLLDYISGVMVSMLSSGVVDVGLSLIGSNQNYKIGICCFSAKHAALRRKSKDWLAWNQENVSKWGNMSNHRLFQWASTIKIEPSVLV